MNEIVKAVNFDNLSRLSLREMLELKFFDIISLRNYLIKSEYNKLRAEGIKCRDAIKLLSKYIWTVEENSGSRLSYKSIERIIYNIKQ